MKKAKIIAVALATAAVASCVALTACSGGATSEGLYAYYNSQNHSDVNNPISYTYKLEVFSDGTYELNYETMWAIPVVDLVYGRDLTSYGTYTVDESNTEEGTAVYVLEMPDRIQFIGNERGAITADIDTARWPQGDEAEGIAPGFTYTLNARAETEVWETADQFIAAYGRAYKITCDLTSGTITKVEITSHNGEQIPGDNAVKPVEDAA